MNKGGAMVGRIAFFKGTTRGKITITDGEDSLLMMLFLRIKGVFGKGPEVIHSHHPLRAKSSNSSNAHVARPITWAARTEISIAKRKHRFAVMQFCRVERIFNHQPIFCHDRFILLNETLQTIHQDCGKTFSLTCSTI